jgi:glycosyltransferase involved in cell wall biosynthesis
MAAALTAAGHPTDVVCPFHASRPRGPADLDRICREFALPVPVRVRTVPYVPVHDRIAPSFAVSAALLCRLGGYDLVYSRSPRTASLNTRFGPPVILEFHRPPAGRWIALTTRLARHPMLRGFVFISEELRRLTSEVIDLSRTPTLVAHDAVDLGRFTPPLSKAEARRRLGLASDTTPVIVHAGHMYRGRGIEVLLEAMCLLHDRVKLLLVGGTDVDVARVGADAASRGLRGVTLVGPRPVAELAPYLFAADALVMPYTSSAVTSDGRTMSVSWASPMKLFEYLAAGRPIVATRFVSIAEVLEDSRNAVLVKPDDPAALAAGIRAVVEDHALADRIAHAARRDAALHTWDLRARAALTLADQGP